MDGTYSQHGLRFDSYLQTVKALNGGLLTK